MYNQNPYYNYNPYGNLYGYNPNSQIMNERLTNIAQPPQVQQPQQMQQSQQPQQPSVKCYIIQNEQEINNIPLDPINTLFFANPNTNKIYTKYLANNGVAIIQAYVPEVQKPQEQTQEQPQEQTQVDVEKILTGFGEQLNNLSTKINELESKIPKGDVNNGNNASTTNNKGHKQS